MAEHNIVNNAFTKKGDFEAAVICSYGLNLNFFENYLLKLDALYNCSRICIITDLQTYDSLSEGGYVAKWLNKKYLVVGMPSIGVFHPKLTLLSSEKRSLLNVGSGNLTRDGISSNLEMLSTFELKPSELDAAAIFHSALDYLVRISKQSNSSHAQDIVNECYNFAGAASADSSSLSPSFLHNLDSSIASQIEVHLANEAISVIHIFSPFYDKQLKVLEYFKSRFDGAAINFYIQDGKSNFPLDSYGWGDELSTIHKIRNIDRYLHGKVIIFEAADKSYLMMGSPNFTRPALLDTTSSGNYEIALFGPINNSSTSTILNPPNAEIKRIVNSQELAVIDVENRMFEGKGQVRYINEATLDSGLILINVDETIQENTFKPKFQRLISNNGKVGEYPIADLRKLSLDKIPKSVLAGPLAIQFIGANSAGDYLESNISWVVNLEEADFSSSGKRYRKVYRDPASLSDLLFSLYQEGEQEDITRFLMGLDIPLDLVFPKAAGLAGGPRESVGNVYGGLAVHQHHFFSQDFQEVWKSCLDRLMHKLEQHVQTPQIEKAGNFFIIIVAVFSLVSFLNDFTYNMYKDEETISADEWSSIRETYNFMFKYISKAWDLFWGKNGYRNSFNTRISLQISDESLVPYNSLEELILDSETDSYDYFLETYKKATGHLEELLNTLRVKTVRGGDTVKPKIFEGIYLQEDFLNSLKDRILNAELS